MRIFPSIALLSFVLFWTFAWPVHATGQATKDDAAEPALHASVTVGGQYVTLGDLFENAGPNAGVNVAYAPAPGQRVILDANWLFNVARRYGLDWRPLNLKTQTIVERDSYVIYGEEIEEELVRALRDQGLTGETEVVFSNRSLRLHVAANQPSTIGIQALTFDRRTGRFVATVAAPADDPSAQRIRVTGRAYNLVSVPVLNKRLRVGDVIGKHDVEMVRVRDQKVKNDTILDPREMIGLAARRSLRPGVPLTPSQMREPLLVSRGSVVTMELSAPYMQLTAQAKALQEGGMGDFIRVENPQSNIVVDAEIIGPNRVRVEQTGKVALR